MSYCREPSEMSQPLRAGILLPGPIGADWMSTVLRRPIQMACHAKRMERPTDQNGAQALTFLLVVKTTASWKSRYSKLCNFVAGTSHVPSGGYGTRSVPTTDAVELSENHVQRDDRRH